VVDDAAMGITHIIREMTIFPHAEADPHL